jgi:hypothetical protein
LGLGQGSPRGAPEGTPFGPHLAPIWGHRTPKMAHFGPILDPFLDPYLGHLEGLRIRFRTRFWGVTGWRRRATISCCCVLEMSQLDPFSVGTPGPLWAPVQGSIPEHLLKGLFGHLCLYRRLSSQIGSRMGSQMDLLFEGSGSHMAQKGPIQGLRMTPVVMGFGPEKVPIPKRVNGI